jgi:chemotaxis protein histidine kinase CheA
MAEGFDILNTSAADLLRRYIADLPDKSAQILDCWQRLKNDSGDQDALAGLSLQVHRLAGSAAPYGLPTLSEAARSVDQVVTPVARAGGSLGPSAMSALHPLMEILQRRLNESQ